MSEPLDSLGLVELVMRLEDEGLGYSIDRSPQIDPYLMTPQLITVELAAIEERAHLIASRDTTGLAVSSTHHWIVGTVGPATRMSDCKAYASADAALRHFLN